jgi:AraC family transcriptional regulator
LSGIAGAHGLLGPDTIALGIYYDDPDATPVEQLRSHACLTVPDTLQPVPAGCEMLDIQPGEFAVGVHRGPYDILSESYRWMFGQWLPSSGREVADSPVLEAYVNDAQTTPPDQLITHVCVPLVPATAAAPA